MVRRGVRGRDRTDDLPLTRRPHGLHHCLYQRLSPRADLSSPSGHHHTTPTRVPSRVMTAKDGRWTALEPRFAGKCSGRLVDVLSCAGSVDDETREPSRPADETRTAFKQAQVLPGRKATIVSSP